MPQQKLTHSVEGCPSGPRLEDLVQGECKGANPHTDQREADKTNDQGTNMDSNKLTKLDMYNILVEHARMHGVKRPIDFNVEERTKIVLKTLYSNQIPQTLDFKNKANIATVTKFISKCEGLYNDSKRNSQRFTKKNLG